MEAVGLPNPALPRRLAARIMWRVEREGTGLTEGCLVSVDDLQNHVENFGEEEQKQLRVDVDTFLQYWLPQSQQFSMQYISHIFGVVWFLMKWGGGGVSDSWDCPPNKFSDAARAEWGRGAKRRTGGRQSPRMNNCHPVLCFSGLAYYEVI